MGISEPIRNLEDIQKISDYFKTTKNKKKYYVIWNLGLYTGLRVSDILGLNIQDVRKKPFLDITEQKTKKHKIIPISDEIKNIIDDYLVNIRQYQTDFQAPDALFVGAQGCRLDRSQVYREINKAAVALYGTSSYFGTHTMRKTFGYHHYKKFKDVVLLQNIFNHSSPAITLKYIGISQDEIENSYKKMNYNNAANNTLDTQTGVNTLYTTRYKGYRTIKELKSFERALLARIDNLEDNFINLLEYVQHDLTKKIKEVENERQV